jgi:hypothetical protein
MKIFFASTDLIMRLILKGNKDLTLQGDLLALQLRDWTGGFA